jgi:hypothetical protein
MEWRGVHSTLLVPEYGAQQITLYPGTSARLVTSRRSLDLDQNHGCQMVAGMMTNRLHYHNDEYVMHVY